jgi:superfamily II DNA or RNA helicase
MSENNNTRKIIVKRCKKGTRKNPQTGKCEPILNPMIPEEGEREPPILEEMKEETIPVNDSAYGSIVLPNPVKKPKKIKKKLIIVDETVDEPGEPEEPEELIEPTVSDNEPGETMAPDNKTKRCPRGYRMNKKTGLCKTISTHTSSKKFKRNVTSKDSTLLNKTKKNKKELKPTIGIEGEEDVLNIQDIIDKNEEKKDAPVDKIMYTLKPQKNENIHEIEKKEYYENLENQDTSYDFLYPHLNDPNFNIKIAKRKEFFNTQYDGSIQNIKKQAEIFCHAEFELMPHQNFVKNFLSFQTPYNSLLLYHSLGTGKTCSAIGIAEEMRTYMKQIGIKQRIMVVASPNVQANFRLQLFDERKLKQIPNPIQPNDTIWNIESCIGNSLLKEINPTNNKGVTREKIISQINSIINTYYIFMGYGQLANYITEKTRIDDEIQYSFKERNDYEIKKIKQFFNNRLIIIDEVHNIRLTDENNNKKAAFLLMKVAKHSENMRLLLLSATPMYNSYKEIIWITNLMNLNDKRSIIEISDVFEKDGQFKEEVQSEEGGTLIEGGKALLKRKLTGYVSYVRGENPYTFPYRIYPNSFDPEHTFIKNKYPTIQMNGKPIDNPIKHVNNFINTTGEYQKDAYSIIIENLRKKSYNSFNIYGEMREMPSFENMESFGYTLLQGPIESLNIVYPTKEMDKLIELKSKGGETPSNENLIKEESAIISNSIGLKGFSNIMKWEESRTPFPIRFHYEYKPAVLKNYGPLFSQEKIMNYSAKIANICEKIRNSTGIVLIYSQYIDGGIIPMALALEEMGFSRFSSTNAFNKSLFKKKRGELVDARTMKTKDEFYQDSSEKEGFNPAKYIMITGEKSLSPSNANDIKFATNADNRYGEKVKVILISKAGSEGLDFKNIRQVHILEPWYNMNRIEQIIGRGVRNLSHCNLPFEERNVEIYLHSTLLMNENEEAADLYVYRLAEKKAIQIGNVTRLIKESSVDCLLNIGQTNFTVEKLQQIAENKNIQLKLSSGDIIDYKIGDKPFTEICDYMENCEFTCSPTSEIDKDNLIQETYSYDYIQSNNHYIIEKIRNLFREQNVYKRDVLIQSINIIKQYPIENIYNSLTYLIHNKNEYIYDKYGRIGNLVNKGEYYLYQPIEVTDTNASIYERSAPIEYKRDSFLLELPKKIQEEKPDVAKEKDGVGEGEGEEKGSSEFDARNMIENIQTNFDYVFQLKIGKIDSGEKNWYKHANLVISHLKDVYDISVDELEKYIIQHNLDMLLWKEKLTLVQYIYSDAFLEGGEQNKIYKIMKQYFDQRILEQSGRTAILLNKEDGWKIYLKPDVGKESPNSEGWEEGEPEDYKFFDQQIDRFILEDDRINNIVGFINMFKKRNMVFKIKDLSQTRNNIGARCGDSTTKLDVIKLLNHFLEKNVYDNHSDILHFGFCVIIETLMRHYTANKKKSKKGYEVYFLTPEETAINDIVKFSRT